jgi:G3E family GTPase
MTTPSTPRLPRVPINLITGFLGTGKTTALLTLLAQKPADQVWAVIVNEFGEVGIDGAVLEGAGAEIREIAGGCLCCATGPQLPITLAKVIREKRPQRVLIEASGLAHASRVVDMLRRPPLAEALDIQATLTLVDPRQWDAMAAQPHPIFTDQIDLADVLVANKCELADAACLARFHARAAALFPPKLRIEQVSHGQLHPAWLTLPARPASSRYRPALPPADSGLTSAGWLFPPEQVFDLVKVAVFLRHLPEQVPQLARAKAVLRVGARQWVWFNWLDGAWTTTEVSWRRDSRFELIAPAGDWHATVDGLLPTLFLPPLPDASTARA